MPSVIMLSVTFYYHYNECHYPECRSAVNTGPAFYKSIMFYSTGPIKRVVPLIELVCEQMAQINESKKSKCFPTTKKLLIL